MPASWFTLRDYLLDLYRKRSTRGSNIWKWAYLRRGYKARAALCQTFAWSSRWHFGWTEHWCQDVAYLCTRWMAFRTSLTHRECWSFRASLQGSRAGWRSCVANKSWNTGWSQWEGLGCSAQWKGPYAPPNKEIPSTLWRLCTLLIWTWSNHDWASGDSEWRCLGFCASSCLDCARGHAFD